MVNTVVNLPNTQSESFKVQLAVGPKKKKNVISFICLGGRKRFGFTFQLGGCHAIHKN